VFKGPYELEGDKPRVFLGPPGGERPKEFRTKEGEERWPGTEARVKPARPKRTEPAHTTQAGEAGRPLSRH
jgi:hypothetical protein